MGEVYRAHDTRLNRDVALKVLPDAFRTDRTRLARFKREAQLLASVNHPHVATLYGVEASGEIDYIVMELVPGTTLADRIRGRRLAVRDALPLLAQVAAALEAAHDKGIVHRDLKPENIRVTPDGRAKVLDFGLARSLVEESASAEVSHGLTTAETSLAGSILGTPAYMSPEQARGLPVDRRTDIWSFGCVCYEVLSGRKAFDGSTLTDVLAEITRSEPDWHALPDDVPDRIRDLLHRCLRKEKERRLQSIADARIELEDAMSEPQPARATGAPRDRRSMSVYIAAAALVGVVTAMIGFRYLRPAGSTQTTRAAIEVPQGSIGYFSGLAISPDGRAVVYGGSQSQPGGPLQLRQFGDAAAQPIAGTEEAYHPFFSPDGRWIGFFTHDKLKKVPVGGGVPETIAPVERGPFSSGSWGADGQIVFVPGGRPAIWVVAATGGTPRPLVAPDPERDERRYLFPETLPDGKAILFTAQTDSGFTVSLFVLSTGERRTLIEGRAPRYSPTGHIVFWQDFSLRAVPFDVGRLAITGPAATVVPDVSAFGGWGVAYSFSASGHLVYFPAFEDKIDRTMAWVDRRGALTPIAESRQNLYVFPRISPDGEQVLVRFEGTSDCYLNTLDLQRGSWSRLTFVGDTHSAVWSRDGTRVAFQSERARGDTLVVVPAAGGSEETVYVSPHTIGAVSWSADGQFLAFAENLPGTGWDVNIMRAERGATPRPFLQTPFAERDPEFSPDGKWIAYVSNESGTAEVYVRPFPGPGPKHPISTGGGSMPRWARGGRELFYRTADSLMSVAIDTTRGFVAGTPTRLFGGDYQLNGGYDVTDDGERFCMVKTKSTPASSQIQVVLNWLEELKQRVPTR